MKFDIVLRHPQWRVFQYEYLPMKECRELVHDAYVNVCLIADVPEITDILQDDNLYHELYVKLLRNMIDKDEREGIEEFSEEEEQLYTEQELSYGEDVQTDIQTLLDFEYFFFLGLNSEPINEPIKNIW